jgi:regulator of replication initiation timing
MPKKIIPPSYNPPKVLLSKKTLAGMSLTIDDQKWIKLLLDTQSESFNDAFDINIKELTGALAEVIQAQNVKVFTAIEDLADSLNELKKDTEHIKEKVKDIETNYRELNNRLIQLKQNIPDELESQLKHLQTDLTNLMKRNRWSAILFRLAITAIITILLAFTILPWYHGRFLEKAKGEPPKTEVSK